MWWWRTFSWTCSVAFILRIRISSSEIHQMILQNNWWIDKWWDYEYDAYHFIKRLMGVPTFRMLKFNTSVSDSKASLSSSSSRTSPQRNSDGITADLVLPRMLEKQIENLILGVPSSRNTHGNKERVRNLPGARNWNLNHFEVVKLTMTKTRIPRPPPPKAALKIIGNGKFSPRICSISATPWKIDGLEPM